MEEDVITIGYTYYTNKPMFEKIKKIYLDNPNPSIKFIVVDDGSPFNALEAEDIPKGWRLYRVLNDIGFNNEGCRNLIMDRTTTNWTLLTDLDHYIKPEYISRAHIIPTEMEMQQRILWTLNRYMPEETKWKVHANSFYVHRDFWKSFGGYDETWSGHYGFDHLMGYKSSIRAQSIRSDRALFKCHPHVELIKEGTASAGSEWTAEKKDKDKNDWRSRKQEFKFTKERIRFQWKRII